MEFTKQELKIIKTALKRETDIKKRGAIEKIFEKINEEEKRIFVLQDIEEKMKR